MAEETESARYNPGDYRVHKHATNYCETMIHLIKASIGTGILAMPDAFAKSGWIMGIIGTVLIGGLCTYCMRILVTVQNELSIRHETPAFSYTETAKYAGEAGPKYFRHGCMPISANMFVLGFQIGAACIYIIFVSKNLQQVIEYYADFRLDIRVYFVLILIPIMITSMISNLKFLAKLTFVANITTLFGFILIFVYIFADLHTFTESIKKRTKIGSVTNYPLFAGTVVFSMEAIGVVMPLENEMKNPKHFTSLFGVLNMSMIPTVFMYIVVGLCGYVKYGEDVAGSITLNLPQKEITSQACKLLLSFGIFATYILALFVAYDIVWKSYIQPKFQFDETTWRTWGIQYLIRVLMIILTCILAIIIPNLALFISLVGSLCLATAGIAYPALFNLCTYWYNYTGKQFYLLNAWYIAVMIFGLIICVIGVTLSIKDIYYTVYAK